MIWSRKLTIISGLALILIVNLIALAGVVYNRSGEPESILHMTQRELAMPYYQWNNTENSVLALRLQWRIPARTDTARQEQYPYGSSNFGPPGWLDSAKMSALGFEESEMNDSGIVYNRGQEKEVLLVLEQEGPAYQKALERSRRYTAHQNQLSLADPGNKNLTQLTKQMNEQLKREESDSTRLFVVDAGLDEERLRKQYPDRKHYAIVHGRIRPQFFPHDKQSKFTGIISGLDITEINVPVNFRQGLQPLQSAHGIGLASHQENFDAEVAFGKRLEPWIMELTAKIGS